MGQIHRASARPYDRCDLRRDLDPNRHRQNGSATRTATCSKGRGRVRPSARSRADAIPSRDRQPAICRLPPQRLPALLGGAVPRHLRDPDRFGRRRLAGLRPDARSVRPRPGRHRPVPAGAAAGAGHRRGRRPLRPPPDHGRCRAVLEALCALALLLLTLRGLDGPSARSSPCSPSSASRAPSSGRPSASLVANLVPPGRLRQRHRLELVRLADGDHRRAGGRRPALRAVGRSGLRHRRRC